MKISILLPYKENFSPTYAGAVSLFVKDTVQISKFRKHITIFGNTDYKNTFKLSYKNIFLKKKFMESGSKHYVAEFLKHEKETPSDIIEIHNRPESLVFLLKKKLNCKFIFVYHNNPQDLRFSKTAKERLFIANHCDQIFFVSKWVMKKFFEKLPFNYKNNCEILYCSPFFNCFDCVCL